MSKRLRAKVRRVYRKSIRAIRLYSINSGGVELGKVYSSKAKSALLQFCKEARTSIYWMNIIGKCGMQYDLCADKDCRLAYSCGAIKKCAELAEAFTNIGCLYATPVER
jgi:hypothetical protein